METTYFVASFQVIILTHYPNHELLNGWEREYKKIVQRYENTIAGTFIGHKHQDIFDVCLQVLT